jgi:hypothetical protein
MRRAFGVSGAVDGVHAEMRGREGVDVAARTVDDSIPSIRRRLGALRESGAD